MTAAVAEQPRAERSRRVELTVVRAVGADLAWKERGDCYGDNDDTMYPENRAAERLVTQRCQILCPVQEQCLAYALEPGTRQDYGVWGGTTERERRALRAAPASRNARLAPR